MHHHGGGWQDKFEPVLDVEIGIVQEDILRACADINSQDFHTRIVPTLRSPATAG